MVGLPSPEQLDYFASQLECCRLCPRQCGVNRVAGQLGYCRAGATLKVASYCLHRGEEPPISGRNGSGTIFFAHCSMRCVYCQNYPISQLYHGNEIWTEDLTAMMLDLERRGAHNINLVTPTHFLPMIVPAIAGARRRGLKLPIVYNTSGYEHPDTITHLTGIVQIYLFDMRYWTEAKAARYSDAPEYPSFNLQALEAVIASVGSGLKIKHGIGEEGLIIRHLVLPSLLDETEAILTYIARELPQEVHLSLMSQYFPANRAHQFPEINRKLSASERSEAIALLHRLDITRGWIQDDTSLSTRIA